MKLLGKDIPARELVERIEDRLRLRGLQVEPSGPIQFSAVEPRVDPLAFNLSAMDAHVDPTRPLPLVTHRGGTGRAVLAAKWAFRKTCQVFINETLGRQRVFNGHVRDAYAQLSADVVAMKRELEALRAQQAVPALKTRPSKRPKSKA
jgi:hypothetical protein